MRLVGPVQLLRAGFGETLEHGCNDCFQRFFVNRTQDLLRVFFQARPRHDPLFV